MQVQVRHGFQFRRLDERGNQKVHFEGEVFELDLPKGADIPHSLERVSKAELPKAESK